MSNAANTLSKKQVFYSKKGWTVGLIIWGTIALLVAVVLIPISKDGLENVPMFVLFILVLIFVLLSWIWFRTFYTLTPDFFHYNSGPIRGKIPIPAIVWVKHQHSLWAGLRVSLAFNGLLVRYNKYDEIYISPADKAAFIYAWQQLNPNVVVKLENET